MTGYWPEEVFLGEGMHELRSESQKEARYPESEGKMLEQVQGPCGRNCKKLYTLGEQNGVCMGCGTAGDVGGGDVE